MPCQQVCSTSVLMILFTVCCSHWHNINCNPHLKMYTSNFFIQVFNLSYHNFFLYSFIIYMFLDVTNMILIFIFLYISKKRFHQRGHDFSINEATEVIIYAITGLKFDYAQSIQLHAYRVIMHRAATASNVTNYHTKAYD